MIYQISAELIEKKILSDQIILATFKSGEIAVNSKPGQFVNIRITEFCYPYLRRPFSICDVEDENFKILFTVFGQGTKALANASVNSKFDVIGPLGNGFSTNDDFDIAVFVGGGIGIAPFPYLYKTLSNKKKIYTYIGSRNKDYIVTYGLENFKIATDDGSLGLRGNVVELFQKDLDNRIVEGKIKVFGCGPTPMLRALKQLCSEYNLNCEVSTEASMACGFGICMGCPIETANSIGYKLVCKDGPVFNIRDIKL